jgi:predicted phage baseplate assembly protein
MPIVPPALDDRSFQDLVDDLLARIPSHAPEYTNPQVGDPGRTLIELFAWLADTILYRANLIPERQRLAFLRLLGTPLRPASPAGGVVSLSFDDELTDAAVLPALTKIDGPVSFESRTPVAVLPVAAQAYCKRPLTADEEAAVGRDVLDALPSVYGLGAKRPVYYVTTPVFAGGAASPGGFDVVQDTVDGVLWLALLAPKPELVGAVQATLGQGLEGQQQILNVGLTPAIEVPPLFEDIGDAARVPHAWEITTGAPSNAPQFALLEPVDDTTMGLTRRGVMRLALPGASLIGAPPGGLDAPLVAGVGGDQPPRLDDAKAAARVAAWVRLRPTQQPGTRTEQLRLSWVGINAVEIDQRSTTTAVVFGTSSGQAGIVMQLPGTNVEAETLQIEVEQDAGFAPWTLVDDLATGGRDDAIYTLDAEAGTITFGDGMRGAIPPAGRRVRAALMRAGGGAAGNLPPGTLRQVKSAVDIQGNRVTRRLKVLQGLATDGGQDSEILPEAEARIPALLRHGDRAVTTEDYQRLAADTPGFRVSRVEVLPRFKPQQRRSDVPGVVSVMALPFKAVWQPPNPRADRPLIEAVHAYLDARRPLGTELYVIGCEYVPLSVTIGVDLRDEAPQEEVLLAVRDAVRRFLWSLAPGGPDGTGWPLGRAVRDRELEVVVAQVPGVSEVNGVNLFQRAGTDWSRVTASGAHGAIALALEVWQLPEVMSVLAVANDDPPDDPTRLPNPFLDDADGLVPVPIVPEVC